MIQHINLLYFNLMEVCMDRTLDHSPFFILIHFQYIWKKNCMITSLYTSNPFYLKSFFHHHCFYLKLFWSVKNKVPFVVVVLVGGVVVFVLYALALVFLFPSYLVVICWVGPDCSSIAFGAPQKICPFLVDTEEHLKFNKFSWNNGM